MIPTAAHQDVLNTRTSGSVLAYLGCLAVGLLITAVWAFVSEIDLSVRAPAVFRPSQGVSLTRNIVAGPVSEVLVRSGERVQRDQVLWTIDGRGLKDQLEEAARRETELQGSLRSMRQYLGFLSDTVPAGGLADRLSRARAEVHASESRRLGLLARRAGVLLERERALPGGMTTAAKILDLESDLELANNALESFRASSLLKIQEQEDLLVQELQASANLVAEVKRKLAECEVRSPANGICDFIRKFGPGDFLLSGEEVIRVVPAVVGSLHVDVLVGARDVMGIKPGNKTAIRVISSKRTELRYLSATVVAVPPDSTKLPGGGTAFVVDAVLDQDQEPWSSGEILPGMEAEAQIVTERKPVLRYLFGSLNFL